VRWMPAADVNRIVNLLGAVTITYLFSRARAARLRAKTAGESG
jgi:hypothetical protein